LEQKGQDTLLRYHLGNLFRMFDRNRDGVVSIHKLLSPPFGISSFSPFPCLSVQINATEFVLGLQLLTQASEREKLSLAFLVSIFAGSARSLPSLNGVFAAVLSLPQLIDTNGDGVIEPPELYRFYLAVFSVLVALSSDQRVSAVF
jgi:hypothetical protein